MRWITLVFILMLIFSRPVWAGAEDVCVKPENNIQRQVSNLQGLGAKLDYLSQTDTSSGFAECPTRGDNATKPDVSWFQRSIAPRDANGVAAHDFFKLMLARLKNIADENIKLSKNIQFCMGPSGKVPDCQKMRDEWIEPDGGLKFKIEEARYHLALARDPQNMRAVMGDSADGLNNRMWTFGIYKDTQWKPMSTSERKAAADVLEQEKADVRMKIHSLGLSESSAQGQQIMKDEMQAIGKGHWNAYRRVLTTAPLVQFISSLNPSDAEIAGAAAKQGALAEKEKRHLEALEKGLDQDPSHLDADLLGLLDYKNVVDQLLHLRPDFCGIAAGFKDVLDQRSFGTNIASMTALFVLAVAVPPTAGIALGAAAGIYDGYSAYQDFNSARTMALSEIGGEKGAPDAAELGHLSLTAANMSTVGLATDVAMFGGISKVSSLLRSEKLFSSIPLAGSAETRAVPGLFRTSLLGND